MPRGSARRTVLVLDAGPDLPARILRAISWADARRRVAAGEATWGRLNAEGLFEAVSLGEVVPDRRKPLVIRLTERAPAWFSRPRARGDLSARGVALAAINEALRQAAPGGTSCHEGGGATPVPAH